MIHLRSHSTTSFRALAEGCIGAGAISFTNHGRRLKALPNGQTEGEQQCAKPRQDNQSGKNM